jgi:soluble lytic murein transglycosylase
LKNKNSLFLLSNFFPIALFLAFLFIFPGCEKSNFWGIKREELKAMISKGDFSFLSNIDFAKCNYEEILQYAPGAAYYLAHILEELQYKELAKKLLALEWERGSPPWKYEAGSELAGILINEEQYSEAQKIISHFINNYGSAYNIEKVKRMSIELLYWQEKDKELLDSLDKQYSDQSQKEWQKTDPELILFKAVAAYRLKKEDWAFWFRTLFYTVPASNLHSRAYTFLLNDKQGLDKFLAYELDIFKAKSLAADGSYKEAQPLLKSGISQLSIFELKDSRLVPDYGLVCLKAGSPLAEAESIEALAGQLQAENRWLALEMAAKIHTAKKSFKKAGAIWRKIWEETDLLELKKRAQWHMLNNAINRGSPAVLQELESPAFNWDDPDFFSDLLENYLSSLVWAKDWNNLWQLYLILKDHGPHEIRLQLSYLVSRLISLGYLKGKTLDRKKIGEELSAKDGYYSFIASHFLNTPPPLLKWEKNSYQKNDTLSDRAKVIITFFSYGLFKQGYEQLSAHIDLFIPDTLFNLAKMLYEQGQYLYAMRVLGLMKNGNKAPLFEEEISLSYPLAYREEITEAAKLYGLDQYLFFALIRRESAFDNKVVSYAGAVGLTQLMPSTAVDLARRIGLREMDLTDPRQNALLGAFFMKDLIRRFKSIPRALAAYNAGPNRVKSWGYTIGNLPDDLYIEAIPILETRKFVKIVCTAALYYSYLYDNAKSPVLRIKELFD